MAHNEISDGVKQYLDNLLRTTTAELKAEIDSLKSLLSKKNDQIDDLNAKVVQVVQRNVEIADELYHMRNRVYQN